MANQFGRRRFILLGGAGLAGTVILNACTKPGSSPTATPSTTPETAASPATPVAANGNTVKVGILHSLSGTMSISEKSVVDAEQMAIAEINAAGGVLGKQIEAIVEDGASDWDKFAEKAKN